MQNFYKNSSIYNFQEHLKQDRFSADECTVSNFSVSGRTVYMSGGIDIETPQMFSQSLNSIYEKSSNSTSPVTLQICNYGGEAYGMFGVVDLMRSSSAPIYTLATGTAMSAASIILAAGHPGERSATKLTTVMIHSISAMLEGTGHDLIVEMNQTKELQNMMINLLESLTNKPAKFWRTSLQRNLYLTTKECLEYGIIDKIL